MAARYAAFPFGWLSRRGDCAGMTRDLDYFAARVAYLSIFKYSVDEAAKILANLIANRLGGLEEGLDEWRVALEKFARDDDALDRLEWMGRRMSAPFTRAEWRELTKKMLELLEKPLAQ